MEKEFTPHQEALELKELGFDEPCFAWYNLGGALLSDVTMGYEETDFLYTQDDMDNDKQCIAPLYQQAFRWFRESKNGSYNHLDFIYEYMKDDSITYEEAELECLKKLIQIVKENKQ